jgi:hypothetical protein
MNELVLQIQLEMDQKRFGELVEELNHLLAIREKRFEPPSDTE